MKKMMGMVWSILGLFVFSLLFFLFLNGMLVPKPPFVRAAKGYQVPDSTATTSAQEAPKAKDDRQGMLEEPQQAARQPEEMALAADQAAEDTAPVVPVPSPGVQEVAALSDTPAPASSSDQRPKTEDSSKPAESTSPFDPEKMSRLVRVYEKMRPKQVGLILDTMPDAQSVAVLGSMKDRAAAQVMAAMEPSKAARMSQLLVERGAQ